MGYGDSRRQATRQPALFGWRPNARANVLDRSGWASLITQYFSWHPRLIGGLWSA